MKKTALIALTMALCLMLSGCITINVQMPNGAPVAGIIGGADGETSIVVAEPEEVPANIPEGAVGFDVAEEEMLDIERSIVPATDKDQFPGVVVDFVIEEGKVVEQWLEVLNYDADYIGKNLSMAGEVMFFGGDGSDKIFGLVRTDIDAEDDPDAHVFDPETGEILEHNHEDVLVGFDCHYEGELPKEGDWVRVVGTLTDYVYHDEETGQSSDALMLEVVYLAPEPRFTPPPAAGA